MKYIDDVLLFTPVHRTIDDWCDK